MEENQKNHIRQNLPELIENTKCTESLLTILQSRYILHDGDIAELDSISNRLTKSKHLYEIVETRLDSFNILCDALRRTNQSGALKILRQLQPNQPTVSTNRNKQVQFEIRPPTRLFTGRKFELLELHSYFVKSNKFQAVIVAGLGGIGKSELCRKYIEKHIDYFEGNAIWVSAEKTESMESDFKILAKDHLQISLMDADCTQKDIKTVVDEVYKYFHNQKVIFVFDNAVGNNENIFKIFMPVRVSSMPNILITSRDRVWGPDDTVMVLEELNQNDAVELLKNGLKLENDDESIKKLTNRLQQLPLALNQAISYIRQQQTTRKFGICQYLKKMVEQSQKLLNHKLPTAWSNRYSETVFTTWNITTQTIFEDEEYGHLAIFLLNLISYMQPEKIPSELLLRCENQDEDDIHSAMQLLLKYSMVNSPLELETFSIHRLVQEITRIELKNRGKEDAMLRECLILFQFNIQENFVDHAITAFSYACDHKSIIEDFSYIASIILQQLRKCTQFTKAQAYYKETIKTLLKHLPDGHVDITRTDFQLAKLTNNREDQFTLLRSVLRKFEANTHLNSVDSEILDVKMEIARMEIHKGNLKEGVAILLAMFKTLIKQEDAAVDLLRKIEKNSNTQELVTGITEAFAVLKNKCRREDCKQVYNILLNIAAYLNDEKDHVNSLLLLETLSDFWKGKVEYPADRTFVEYRIAMVYYKAGYMNKGISLLQEIYVHIEKGFKIDIVWTDVGYDFAMILFEQKSIPQAAAVATKVHHFRNKFLGSNHMKTLDSLRQVGDCKREAGDHVEGLRLILEAHNKLSELVGPFHITTIRAKISLATCFKRLGKYENALIGFTATYFGLLDTFEFHHEHVLQALTQIAEILLDMNNLGGSLSILGEVERRITSNFGAQDSRLSSIRQYIAMLQEKMKEEHLRCLGDTKPFFNYYELRSEQARISSFVQHPGWTINRVKLEDFAKAGFFYVGDEDKVQCAFCCLIVDGGEQLCDPRSFHLNTGLHWCPFAMGLPVGNKA